MLNVVIGFKTSKQYSTLYEAMLGNNYILCFLVLQRSTKCSLPGKSIGFIKIESVCFMIINARAHCQFPSDNLPTKCSILGFSS